MNTTAFTATADLIADYMKAGASFDTAYRAVISKMIAERPTLAVQVLAEAEAMAA